MARLLVVGVGNAGHVPAWGVGDAASYLLIPPSFLRAPPSLSRACLQGREARESVLLLRDVWEEDDDGKGQQPAARLRGGLRGAVMGAGRAVVGLVGRAARGLLGA